MLQRKMNNNIGVNQTYQQQNLRNSQYTQIPQHTQHTQHIHPIQSTQSTNVIIEKANTEDPVIV